ncbi:MAG TPA: helix-turn-helix transcriptional regulator [Candidatus Coproplasma excrementavium]|nr:helix-turn-helix transcriptional regulator [Candidatus Coproplasma excrementavium]
MRTKNNSVRLAEIQQRLREEIKNSGMTQREIAAAMGVSAQTVSRYMTDDIFPALDTLARLCEVLDVSADYILGTEKN